MRPTFELQRGRRIWPEPRRTVSNNCGAGTPSLVLLPDNRPNPNNKTASRSASAPACLKPQITSPAQTAGLYDCRLAAFFSAFFSRRGNRLLFFFLSFGTFGALGLRGGASTPTSAAILPAAVPIVFAASIRTLSSASAFFVICISSTLNERDSRANGARKIRSGRTALLKQCPLLVTLSSTLPPASLSATMSSV